MKKMKTLLSLVLVLIICFSVVPMTDFGIEAEAAESWNMPITAYLKIGCGFACKCRVHGGNHKGQDFPANKGTKVMATKSGTVVVANLNCTHVGNSCSICYGWGKYVKIKHDDGYSSLYAHLSSVSVKEGDRVKQGDKIGGVGTTGFSTGNHLHFEIYNKSGNRVDPMNYIDPTHSHSYTTKTETAHPHKYYKVCSCGDKYYTGSNDAEYTYKNESTHPHKQYKTCWCGNKSYTGAVGTVRTCSKCWDVEFSSSKESLTIRGGNSDTFTIKMSGSVAPEGWVYNCVYDTSIISVTKNEKEYTVTGLRCGETDIVFTAYTDRNKTEVITGLTIPVKVTSTPYLIQYKANGGENAPSPQVKTYGNDIALSSDEPTRDGYIFLGWSKDEHATYPDSSFDPGDKYTNNAMLTLYAVWKKVFYGDLNNDGKIDITDVNTLNKMRLNKIEYTSLDKLKGDLDGDENLTFDDMVILQNFKDGETTTFPVENMFSLFYVEYTGKSTYRGGESIDKNSIKAYIVYNNANYHVVDTGFTVSPQYADGSGQQKVTVTVGDWSDYFYITVDNTIGYTLTYNANGGSNAPSIQTGAVSYNISSTVPTRNGYTFLGWSTNRYATTATYKPGSRLTLSSNMSLYAVWKSASTVSVGSSNSANVEFANQERSFTYTPTTSGDYIFESTGDLDTEITLYDSSWNEIGTDDDSGQGNNFMLRVTLTAGAKYYVYVAAYSTKSGSTTFEVYKNTVGHNHSYTPNVTKDPTCIDSGILTYSCPCGTTYTETIDAEGHEFETELTIDKEVTCTENGKKSRHCIYCDATYDEEIIEATGHDFDGSKCKNCDYDKISDCSCNCHKGGISGFFFKLINFFEKLFGKNKVCACGVKH